VQAAVIVRSSVTGMLAGMGTNTPARKQPTSVRGRTEARYRLVLNAEASKAVGRRICKLIKAKRGEWRLLEWSGPPA
jgi:hypothetical protein